MKISKELLVAFSDLLMEAESIHFALDGFGDSDRVQDLDAAIDAVRGSLCRWCRSGDRAKEPCWRCVAYEVKEAASENKSLHTEKTVLP